MSYRADKQVIDTHTHRHTDRHTDAGDDNTRRPKLASGKNSSKSQDVLINSSSLDKMAAISQTTF